ncbi:hypothetical protein, partial [Enterobacter hormaechei]
MDEDEFAICIACQCPVKDGDLYYEDVTEGPLHAACCGPEPESYHRNGEPLKPGDPIPEPEIYRSL